MLVESVPFGAVLKGGGGGAGDHGQAEEGSPGTKQPWGERGDAVEQAGKELSWLGLS